MDAVILCFSYFLEMRFWRNSYIGVLPSLQFQFWGQESAQYSEVPVCLAAPWPFLRPRSGGGRKYTTQTIHSARQKKSTN